MKLLSSSVLAVLLAISDASLAIAQPYVGGSIFADVVRASGPDNQPGSGEALGGALRVGTSLGESWGVDLEFARSRELEWQPDVRILAELTRSLPGVLGLVPDVVIFPTPEISVEAQLSTLTTMLWWRQEVTDRFDLVYLGGAAFTRTATDSSVSFRQILPSRGLLPIPQLFVQESVGYDTGVIVGLDGSIEMTDHLRLVPGLRMSTVSSRWIVRPSAGLQWKF